MITKIEKTAETYLGNCQTSMIEFFLKIVNRLKAINLLFS